MTPARQKGEFLLAQMMLNYLCPCKPLNVLISIAFLLTSRLWSISLMISIYTGLLHILALCIR
jgi:hypothetical protein